MHLSLGGIPELFSEACRSLQTLALTTLTIRLQTYRSLTPVNLHFTKPSPNARPEVPAPYSRAELRHASVVRSSCMLASQLV
jgi:hypothetical protein